MDEIDVVVHAAAIHGIHLATHSADDFFELNVRGTFNVWEAAAAAGVKRFRLLQHDGRVRRQPKAGR